jgi:hypothetical protein
MPSPRGAHPSTDPSGDQAAAAVFTVHAADRVRLPKPVSKGVGRTDEVETEETQSSFPNLELLPTAGSAPSYETGFLQLAGSGSGQHCQDVLTWERCSGTTNSRTDLKFPVDHVLTAKKHQPPSVGQTKGSRGSSTYGSSAPPEWLNR